MITAKQQKILSTYRRHPNATGREIAERAGASADYTIRVLRQRGIELKQGRPRRDGRRAQALFDAVKWAPWLGILNDHEIARLSGCPVTEVRKRRVAAGLPPVPSRQRYGQPVRQLLCDLRALYPSVTQRALARAAGLALGREISEALASQYLRFADPEVHRG